MVMARSWNPVTLTHTAHNATTESSTCLAANLKRKYALIVNDSDAVVYINFGATAAANTGIRLNANGGSYEISHALGNLITGAIKCIHAGTGNKVLIITEGV